MKKKILTLCLVVALVAIAAVSASLAYFTDTDQAENVFAVGNVQIEMNEYERQLDADGNYTSTLIPFEQNQVIMPAVYPASTNKADLVVDGHTIKIRDNVENYVDKIINVTNKGKSDAYVRTIIAVPAFPEASAASVAAGLSQSEEPLHWNAVSDTDTTPANGWYWGTKATGEYPDDADMNKADSVTIDGQLYDIYVVTNVNVLEAGKSTSPCLAGFYLDNNVDCEVLADGKLNYFIEIAGTKYDLGDISELSIFAYTQAVQTQGFEDAWTALDEAFGPVTGAQFLEWFNK